MQRSNNYAANQVRFFLSELKNGNNTSKLKAIQRFQGYLERFQPEIYDDTVQFLFTGEDEVHGNNALGLIYFCGIESDKHPGQLKRICGPLLSFVRWLLHQTDDIYLNNFVKLSQEELYKINFPKHILNQSESGKLTINIGTSSRGSKAEDAFELLHILYQDHRNFEDEQEPIDINYLLQGDTVCYDRFHAWLQKSNLDTLEEELANRVRQPRQKIIPRPKCWDEVTFKPIPLQEGEEVGTANVEEGPTAPPPIPDPLKLRDVDLRETQEIYATGGLQKRMMAARRATELAGGLAGGSGATGGGGGRGKSMGRESTVMNNSGLQLVVDEDEDDAEDDVLGFGASAERRGIRSVIPSDKAFSIPLFLNLVHGGTTFTELGVGLGNLRSHLQEQSTRRVNLVRNHFGLFSQCAEGLEWLKEYRKGNLRVEELPGKERNYRKEREAMRRASANSNASNKPQIVKGMEQLRRAFGTLDLAKVEAKNTLAPILERMRKMREVRSAEKVLKGMSTLLDYPRSMKTAYERGELKDVVALYQRVQSIPETSGLKITTKIKRAAEAVVLELKKTSLTQALSPTTNVNVILRHAQIMLALEGGTSYLKILRLSFLRQSAEFLKAFREIRERMMLDMIDAYDQGQEVSLALKSSSLMGGTGSVVGVGGLTAGGVGGGVGGGGGSGSSDHAQQIFNLARRFWHGTENGGVGLGSIASGGSGALQRPRPQRAPSTSSLGGGGSGGGSGIGGGGGSSGGGFNRPRIASNASTNSGGNGPSGGGNSSTKKHRNGSFATIDTGLIFYDDDAAMGSPNTPRRLSADAGDDTASLHQSVANQGGGAAGGGGTAANEWTDGVHNAATLDEVLAQFEDDAEWRGDYSLLFCHLVRRTYAERLVDLVARWFPCLFRLCCEIATFHNTDKGSGGGGGGIAQRGGLSAFNTTFTKTMKSTLGLTSVSKLLGMLLLAVADNVQQTLHGLRPSTFLASFVPNEVTTAMNELDNDLQALQSSYGLEFGVGGVGQLSTAAQCTLEMTATTMTRAVRFVDIAATHPLTVPLRHLSEALLDVFVLYEALETAFKTAWQKISATNAKVQQEHQAAGAFFASPVAARGGGGGGGGGATFRPFPAQMPTFHGHKHAAQLANVVVEMDISSPLSPFFEACRIFTLLAKESEASVTQTVLTRLVDRVGESVETLLFEHDVEKLFNYRLWSSPYGCVLVPEAVGVETTVHEFEAMIARGIAALSQVTRRSDWTAHQVYEGVLQKALVALVDQLRRKAMLIDDLRVTSTMSNVARLGSGPGGSSPPASRRGPRRGSMTQDNLVLSSLEEDLKHQADSIGWERDFASLRQTKNAAWIDFLRGAIRLRAVTLPRLLRKIASVFSIDDALLTLSTAASSSASTGGVGGGSAAAGTSSSLASVGVFGSTDLLPGSPSTAAVPPAPRTPGESLLNRLFATESSPELSTDADGSSGGVGAAGGRRGLRRESSQYVPSSVSSAAVATSASTSALPSATTAATATAYANANGNANVAAGSLADRLMNDWSGATSRLLRLDAAQYAQVFKLVRPLISDIVGLERDLVERYLAHRTQGLRAIVTTAYAYRVDAELTNMLRQRGSGSSRSGAPSAAAPSASSGAPSSQQLPGHLKRVLLALHEEKRALQQCLGAMSVDTGHNRRVFRQMKRSVQEQFLRQQQQQPSLSSPLATAASSSTNAAVSPETGGFSDSDQDEHDDDLLGGGDGDGADAGRGGGPATSASASSTGSASAALSAAQQRRRRLSAAANTRYAHYLHQQLCQRLLDAVEDVVKRLYAGHFGVLATAGSVSNANKASETQPENPFKQSSRSTTTSTSSSNGNAAGAAMIITTTTAASPSTTATATAAATPKVALANLPVASILQAAEDLEFLKTVLRPLLLDTQVLLKKQPLSAGEVQQLQAQVLRSDGGVEVVNSEQLLQWGQLLVVLIQQHQ